MRQQLTTGLIYRFSGDPNIGLQDRDLRRGQLRPTYSRGREKWGIACLCCSFGEHGGGVLRPVPIRQVIGAVQDQTGALIPGVTVTATDVTTGVVTTQVTNEAGAYFFGSLLPGKYKISAALSGFQTQTLTDIRLIISEQYRFNFTLKVASATTSVEVTIPTDSLIATPSSTVGQVLSKQKVEALPLVGNNVLNLISTLAGVGNDGGNEPRTVLGSSKIES